MNLANLDFLKLDPRYFKAFIAAAEFENFSTAANQAAMTQSGISQHISKLEEQLGVSLFMRNSKATVLTEDGRALLTYIRGYNDSIQSLLNTIHKGQKHIEGLVSYAMPPSCLLSPHFPMLLERRLAYPDLELKVQLMPNDDILPLVIDGAIDFGFVTERVEHPLLTYQKFCDEEYIFVGTRADQIRGINSENLIQQKFINYPGMGVYFNYWIKYFLPECSNISDRSLYHAGEMNSIEGAIHMVAGSLGISVFPRHCVQHLIDAKTLFEYEDAARPPLTNTIHIVTRKHLVLPARVKIVIDWFIEMHKDDPK